MLISVYEYDAYGIARVTRSVDLKGPYRYGFQGMLRMSEVAPSTTIVNDYATLFRTYDARTGRWTSHDPILQPWESTYAGLAGNPAMLTDWFGLKCNMCIVVLMARTSPFTMLVDGMVEYLKR